MIAKSEETETKGQPRMSSGLFLVIALVGLLLLQGCSGFFGLGLVSTILFDGSIPKDRLEIAAIVSGIAWLFLLVLGILAIVIKRWWKARPFRLLVLIGLPVAWVVAHNLILHAVCPFCNWASKIGRDTTYGEGPSAVQYTWVRLHDSPQLVAGNDQAIWVTDLASARVSRVDPQSLEILAEIDVGGGPVGIALFQADLWVANRADGTVSRIDTDTNQVLATIPVGDEPFFIAGGLESVWVTNKMDGTLSRIDPTTNDVIATIKVGNGPSGVAIGHGSVWVLNFEDETLVQIDPISSQIAATIPIERPSEFIATTNEAVLVSTRDGLVTIFDPITGDSQAVIQVGEQLSGMAVDQGGIWVADYATGTLLGLDTKKNEVLLTLPVGKSPLGVTYASGFVWVVNNKSGTLSRVTPGTITAPKFAPTPTATTAPADYYERGMDYQRADNLDSAIEEFSRAVELDPQYVDAYFERGRTYALLGSYALAIADWSKAIELYPNYTRAYLFRAYAYADSGDYEQAVSDYGEVISLAPFTADNYYWRGIAYAESGETVSAISDLEKALEFGLETDLSENAESFLDELRRLIAGEVSFDGHWGGNTDQGEVFEFTIEDGGIVSPWFGFQIPGCESLSPVSFSGRTSSYVEGNRFSVENYFATISGTFTSSSSAVGTLEIDCEDGLSTSWNARKGVRAVRTPTPEDMAKIPDFAIGEGLFSRTDGSQYFDEFTSIVASNGDWYLVRNFSESILPIPSGWTSVSTPDGGYFIFSSEGDIEDPSVSILVARDCTEAETADQLLSVFEESLIGELSIAVLKREVLDAQKGYLFASVDRETDASVYLLIMVSKPSEGCFFYLSANSRPEDWEDYYPLVRVIFQNWFDLSGNPLGVTLPERLLEDG